MVTDIFKTAQGLKVRLGVVAPPDVAIDRCEVRRAIERNGGVRKKQVAR